MEPYKVYMKSDLKKMILDIIKFDIIKERSVTELLFFNNFQPILYASNSRTNQYITFTTTPNLLEKCVVTWILNYTLNGLLQKSYKR